MNVNNLSGTMSTIFGKGIFGVAATGLIRLPALLASIAGVSMVGELAIRLLSHTLSTFGMEPKEQSTINTMADTISKSGIRPHKEMALGELVISSIAFCALGIIANEFVSLIGGRTPGAYNNVLSFLGPIRINPDSYFSVIAGKFSFMRII